ncbi:acyl-CoA dehydrogenase family protein [Nocardioides sp. YJ-D4]
MHWHLTQEQVDYQQALRGWLTSVATPEALRDWGERGAEGHRTFVELFASAGWAGVGIEEEHGGQGGGLVELALTAEELGRACAPSSAWLATVLAAPFLRQQPAVLEAALSGETVAVLGRSDAIPSSWAEDSGTTVPRVLAADIADRWIVLGERGAGLLPGAEAVVVRRDLLDRSRSVADVTLGEGAGEPLTLSAPLPELLAEVSATAAVLVAADALGASQRMLDLAVAYSLQRHQFGVPIGSFQAVKHAAATMLVGIEAARSSVYFAAASVDGRAPGWDQHAAAVKAEVTAEASRAADSALTLHGAIGYTWEHDLQLFYKRALLDEQLFGTPGAWLDVLADSLEMTPTL